MISGKSNMQIIADRNWKSRLAVICLMPSFFLCPKCDH